MKILKKPIFLIIAVLMFTVFLYFPGLSGDYVFDDSANILENNKLTLTTLDLESLNRAWHSGDAGPLGRPISMLSFALNHYFNGSFEPYYFKLTNLIIHLINGLLVYFISLNIFKFLLKSQQQTIKYAAIFVMLVWLIHPLNLTSVLYVVQRMTSLSTLFGLLSILLYSYMRNQNFSLFKVVGFSLIILITILCSALSKESGLLFLGLILISELGVYKGKNIHSNDIRVLKIKLIHFTWLIFLIGVIGYFVLFFSALEKAIFPNRNFTTLERIFTESRVLFYYLKMFFFPLLQDLSLYHDDFVISRSIIQPITTLYSILALVVISVLSFLIYKKNSLILFAWLWFLVSHAMESSFISLELVHEHRNYFATLGFLILIAHSLLIYKFGKIKKFIYLFIMIVTVNYAFTTWQRALIWSNLVDHAAFEATMHPYSDRANYQMARIYMKLMLNSSEDEDMYKEKALIYLNLARQSYLPENGAWFAEIRLRQHFNESVDERLINELINNLKNKPFYNSNLSFIQQFSRCQISGYCRLEHHRAVEIITASLYNKKTSPNLKSEIYKILGQYFIEVAGDLQKGEEFLLDAINLRSDVNGHLLLSQIYRLQNKLQLSSEQLEIAIKIDKASAWSKEIAIEKRNIESALQSSKGSKLEN